MMAYDANLTAGELKIADYAILMVDKYRDIVDNLPKDTAYKERFFSKWPDSLIPQAYHNWVDELYKKGPFNTNLNSWLDRQACAKVFHFYQGSEIGSCLYLVGSSLMKQ